MISRYFFRVSILCILITGLSNPGSSQHYTWKTVGKAHNPGLLLENTFSYFKNDSLLLHVRLINTTSSDLQLFKPFHIIQNKRSWFLKISDSTLIYDGLIYENSLMQGLDDSSNYYVLPPGDTIQSMVNISKFYDISAIVNLKRNFWVYMYPSWPCIGEECKYLPRKLKQNTDLVMFTVIGRNFIRYNPQTSSFYEMVEGVSQ